MSQPVTAAQLIDRLREVYEAETGEKLSNENLAGRLPITLSTFNRWKKGDTRAFRDTIAMLDRAGWLSIGEGARADGDSSPGRPPDIQDGVAQLLLGQAEGIEILERIERALSDEHPVRKRAVARKTAARPKRP